MFCVLIDESGDVAGKEIFVVVICYVNSEVLVKESFLGIVIVKETSAKSLKEELEKLLYINGFHLSSISGQRYDGASNIQGCINDLSELVQKRGQDLLNVLSLVNATKQELQEMRNDGWEEAISNVMEICNNHDIDVPDMNAPVLDLQVHELYARFDEENTELLQCVSCLSPSSPFSAFDVKKLLRIVELYPNNFVDVTKVVV
ncbi:uncharacterized protein LOC131632536 [Vicia villosa]|uniref:uncharacterized protein LOC131632536 n=1 Tax=Vicia villosa TaxID=3911 RepID=UPI00273C8FD1|nr:uncharacterized protein LOC131632536 [Vicia villosa]